MTTVVDEGSRPRPTRFDRPTWVKFSSTQRRRLEEIAYERGMALAQVVRQAAVVQLDLPRESIDLEDSL